MSNPIQAKQRPFKNHVARHFRFETDEDGRVATITMNRPEKKNPLTFESYEELGALFRVFLRQIGQCVGMPQQSFTGIG